MAKSATKNRAYSAAHYFLELDDDSVGIIRSVDGGGVKSEIMTYQMGSNHDLWRQIGKPKYEDLKIEFGMSMSDHFYKWIQDFFAGKVERRNGAIVAGDFHYNERARRRFQDAIISEITFPKLDGSDKNACHMSATIVPEILRFEKPSNKKLDHQIGTLKQKLWTASAFEFQIDGPLKDTSRRVTKIDSFTIKQQVHEYHSGNHRDSLRVPGLIEFPNLTFYLPEADAQPFVDHYTKFGIEGTVQSSPRLTGSIELKDNTGKTLCTVSITGMDISNLTADKSESGSEQIKEVKLEVSVESMKFQYTGAGLD